AMPPLCTICHRGPGWGAAETAPADASSATIVNPPRHVLIATRPTVEIIPTAARAESRGDRDVPGLAGHPVEPFPDGRISAEVESALYGHVGVGVEGDVGDGVALVDQEAPRCQVGLHRIERPVAACLPLQQLIGEAVGVARVGEPEAGDGDVRLVAVLLEE